ncbi:MAG TPA: hypothetical protein VKI18_13385 [Albitalea sp.]|nr:hypothetical protein [Albitalea sp.]
MTDLDKLPPFPTLLDEPVEAWAWPEPPFTWRHTTPPGAEVAQACRIRTSSGSQVDGYMLGIDMAGATLRFGSTLQSAPLNLPFTRFLCLTLTTALASTEPLPAAAHESEYRLWLNDEDGSAPVLGRSVGHVEREEGLYLFEPVDAHHALLRVFVPRRAYRRCEFGPTSRDSAAEHWIATPEQLAEALHKQASMPVLPIGQSLLNLGLVTRAQLDRALERNSDAPLGERLVESGVISQADLQTAIAHKMGYPLVDLTRFPIDPNAAHKLPLKTALVHRALPIRIDGMRLIVAVDKPARLAPLQALFALKGFQIVPVLASKSHILLALSSLPHQDAWSDNVTMRFAEHYADSR